MEINKNTPKTHLRMMENYCEKRVITETQQYINDQLNASMIKFEKAKEQYESNGTIEPETIQSLFDVAIGVSQHYLVDNQPPRRDFSNPHEKELIKKQYNPDEVYKLYSKNMSIFEDLLSEKEEEKQSVEN